MRFASRNSKWSTHLNATYLFPELIKPFDPWSLANTLILMNHKSKRHFEGVLRALT